MSLGPIGFRGPASRIVPDHLTVIDGTVRTVQHITPGVRCRSNLLVGDVLDRIGEDLLFITSANRSSYRTGRGGPLRDGRDPPRVQRPHGTR